MRRQQVRFPNGAGRRPELTTLRNTDRPFTDLYDTEGDGGYPGINFMARPVVGGHFAFLALERACGGKATEALKFLDERPAAVIHVEQALLADGPGESSWSRDL